MIGIGLTLIVVGVVLAILGFAWTAASWLLWIGLILLVVGAVLALIHRSHTNL
jgi:hypothetical protein